MHEGVTVKSEDREDNSFNGIMFDISAGGQNKPLEFVLVESIWVCVHSFSLVHCPAARCHAATLHAATLHAAALHAAALHAACCRAACCPAATLLELSLTAACSL